MSEHKSDLSPKHRANVPTKHWPLLMPSPKELSSPGESLIENLGDRAAVVVGAVAALALMSTLNHTAPDEYTPLPEHTDGSWHAIVRELWPTDILNSADITHFDPNALNGVPFYNPDETGE